MKQRTVLIVGAEALVLAILQWVAVDIVLGIGRLVVVFARRRSA